MPTLVNYCDIVFGVAAEKRNPFISKKEVRDLIEDAFKNQSIPFIESSFNKAYEELEESAKDLIVCGSA